MKKGARPVAKTRGFEDATRVRRHWTWSKRYSARRSLSRSDAREIVDESIEDSEPLLSRHEKSLWTVFSYLTYGNLKWCIFLCLFYIFAREIVYRSKNQFFFDEKLL